MEDVGQVLDTGWTFETAQIKNAEEMVEAQIWSNNNRDHCTFEIFNTGIRKLKVVTYYERLTDTSTEFVSWPIKLHSQL